MADPEVRVDASDFKRLFGKSSQVEKKLQTALRRNIRRVAGEAAAAVKTEVVSHPGRTVGRRRQHKGLRSNIAAGVAVKVMTGNRSGVAIVASSKALPAGDKSMLYAWQSKKGWRHPVFGTDKWVAQQGRPYFVGPILARQPRIRAAVEEAMQEAAQSLKGNP